MPEGLAETSVEGWTGLVAAEEPVLEGLTETTVDSWTDLVGAGAGVL